MPNAKVGTLVKSSELEQSIQDAKKGQVTYRVDTGRNIHVALGNVQMDEEKIL